MHEHLRPEPLPLVRGEVIETQSETFGSRLGSPQQRQLEEYLRDHYAHIDSLNQIQPRRLPQSTIDRIRNLGVPKRSGN